MKDSDFIELLNLYLDHEISSTDAARLEAEVLRSPARRRVYQQYCQMQKACKVLAADFQGEDASSTDRNVIAFESARSARPTNFYAVGALAAMAACLAVVFVSRSREQSPVAPRQNVATVSAPLPAAVSSVVVSQSTRSSEEPVKIPTTRDQPKAKLFGGLSLADNSGRASDPLLSASGQDAAQFAWMLSPNLQLAPVERVSIDQFRFDSRSAVQAQPTTTQTNRQPPQNGMEWNAIKYRKLDQ